MDIEVAKIIRGMGIVLMIFSGLMLSLIIFIGPVMLGMDIPMMLIGIAMVVYGHVQVRKAPPSA